MLKWKRTSSDWEARTTKIFIILRPKLESDIYSGDIFILNTFLCIPIPPFEAKTPEEAHKHVENSLCPILRQALEHLSNTLENIAD